jgi:Insecticide toxin TcdB middle/N-terminal region/FG-GAP-like repeat
LLSNGDGTFTGVKSNSPAAWGSFGSPALGYAQIVGDFNGDGKTDFGMFSGQGIWTLLSNGDGTFTGVKSNTPAAWGSFGSPPSAYAEIAGDFNGDGKADFLMFAGQGIWTFVSNGDGTFMGVKSNSPAAWGSFGSPPSTYAQIVGDFNGDGKADFLMFSGDTVWAFLANGVAVDLIGSIATGLGATTAVGYAPLTNSNVYTKDTTSIYPIQDTQGPFYVVSRVDTSNGIGGTYSLTYAYAGAKLDLSGRGFLGFRQISTTDLQTNIVQTTTYGQSFPYIGLMGITTKTLGSLTLNQATSSYQFSNAGGAATLSTPSLASAPYSVSVAQSVSSSSDLDGSKIPPATTSYKYGDYGNATQVVVSTSDGFSKTTANTYSNDPTNWFLGRLTGASVTSVSP